MKNNHDQSCKPNQKQIKTAKFLKWIFFLTKLSFLISLGTFIISFFIIFNYTKYIALDESQLVVSFDTLIQEKYVEPSTHGSSDSVIVWESPLKVEIPWGQVSVSFSLGKYRKVFAEFHKNRIIPSQNSKKQLAKTMKRVLEWKRVDIFKKSAVIALISFFGIIILIITGRFVYIGYQWVERNSKYDEKTRSEK